MKEEQQKPAIYDMLSEADRGSAGIWVSDAKEGAGKKRETKEKEIDG